MRIVIQRVTNAKVEVEGKIVGSIERARLCFLARTKRTQLPKPFG